MSRSSIPFKFDKLGGLSHLKDFYDFDYPEQETEKIKKYMKKHVLPLSINPKIVFFVYIFAAILLFIFFLNLILVTTIKSDAIIGIMIACPILLILMGAVGGHFEDAWDKMFLKMQTDILKMTNNECSIEKGFVPRCSKSFEGSRNFVTLKHSHFVLFIINKTPFSIQSGEIYSDEVSESKCILIPYHSSSVERLNRKMKYKGKTNKQLKINQKAKQPESTFTIDIEKESIKKVEMIDLKTHKIKMSTKQPNLNDYQVDNQSNMSDHSDLGNRERRFSEGDVKGDDFWGAEPNNRF